MLTDWEMLRAHPHFLLFLSLSLFFPLSLFLPPSLFRSLSPSLYLWAVNRVRHGQTRWTERERGGREGEWEREGERQKEIERESEKEGERDVEYSYWIYFIAFNNGNF